MKRNMLSLIAIAAACTVGLTTAGLVAVDKRFTVRPAQLSKEATGDVNISRALSTHAPEGAHNLAGLVISDGNTRFGGLGADQNTEFEIGSISKTFNTELLRILSERGDVSPQTRVGEIIDTNAPIADVTLEELATHTSGLPRLAGISLWRILWSGYAEKNPYEDITAADILELAPNQKLNNRGTEAYSNYGAALLGQLLATKAGTTWPELIEREILKPLGMDKTYVATFGRVPDSAPTGINQFGRPAANWEMDGYAPAGAIRSTAKDMAKYATYLLKKGIPNYGWQLDSHGAWHNGGTAGFSTQLRIDVKNQRAAYVAGDTETLVDEVPDALLNALG